MNRARQIFLAIAAVASVAFSASVVQAHPGGSAGRGHDMGAHGQGQERHAAMQAHMAQMMAQHAARHGAQQQGDHGPGRHGKSTAGGCRMGAQASAEGENKQ